jgi:hypothetical protein
MTELFDCNHPKIEKFVRNEIIANMSLIVPEIIKAQDNEEDYYNLYSQEDYYSAIIEYNFDEEEEKELLEEWDIETIEDLTATESDLYDIANRYNIDPIIHEVYEYYSVSGFLADRLETEGEIVERDFFGHTIWGRCTTGQSVTLDYVIRKIVTDLHNEVEEMSNRYK